FPPNSAPGTPPIAALRVVGIALSVSKQLQFTLLGFSSRALSMMSSQTWAAARSLPRIAWLEMAAVVATDEWPGVRSRSREDARWVQPAQSSEGNRTIAPVCDTPSPSG